MSQSQPIPKILSWQAVLESVIIAVVVTTFFGLRMFINDNPHFGWQIGLMSFTFTFTVAFLITIQDHLLVNWFQVKFPWQSDNVKRIAIEFIVTSVGAGIIITLVFLSFIALYGEPVKAGPLEVRILDHIGIAVMINLVMLGISETNFLVKQWKQSIVKAEKIKHEHAVSQYQALNNQVNPHFLFNNLNTLAALIPQSQKKSLEFISRFSEVYRYVLDAGEKTVIELSEELDFIHAYIFLQKARHGQNLQVNINIGAEDLQKLIPPLSLQILVENAFTHNEVSESKPLKVDIYSACEYLFVDNNYQPRNEGRKTPGYGLKNLENRYAFLTDKQTETGVSGRLFRAAIPLIRDEG